MNEFIIRLCICHDFYVLLQDNIKRKAMDKITIVMSQHEYKKFLAYKEADKIARSIRRSILEAKEVRDGKRKLKSAYALANEL